MTVVCLFWFLWCQYTQSINLLSKISYNPYMFLSPRSLFTLIQIYMQQQLFIKLVLTYRGIGNDVKLFNRPAPIQSIRKRRHIVYQASPYLIRAIGSDVKLFIGRARTFTQRQQETSNCSIGECSPIQSYSKRRQIVQQASTHLHRVIESDVKLFDRPALTHTERQQETSNCSLGQRSPIQSNSKRRQIVHQASAHLYRAIARDVKLFNRRVLTYTERQEETSNWSISECSPIQSYSKRRHIVQQVSVHHTE